MGLIDLNSTEEDETPSSSSSSTSSSSFSVAELNTSGGSGSNLVVGALASASASSLVCLELWHACAGPLISLLKRGSVVVYFLRVSWNSFRNITMSEIHHLHQNSITNSYQFFFLISVFYFLFSFNSEIYYKKKKAKTK